MEQDVDFSYIPESILNNRDSPRGKQVLIKWQGKPIEEATWEDKLDFATTFPYFSNIGDNVNFHGGGVDTTHMTSPSDDTGPTTNRPKRTVKMPAKYLE